MSKTGRLITTPIYYCNAKPHIGHVYTTVVADALARFARLAGHPTLFSTGTDEHGAKVQQAATDRGQDPQTYVNLVAHEFESIAKQFNSSHDVFVRTSDARHKAIVQQMWTKIMDRGFIYLGEHEGWYCQNEETFIPESQTQLSQDGQSRVITERPWQTVEFLREPNYKFRLSLFKDPLLRWLDGAEEHSLRQEADEMSGRLVISSDVTSDQIINHSHNSTSAKGFSGPLIRNIADKSDVSTTTICPVYPSSRAAEVRAMLESGLEDLSVSRVTKHVKWGIPVPNDPDHTIYVWLDALTNYITVTHDAYKHHQDSLIPTNISRNDCSQPLNNHWWPPFAHIIGKDILKFHAIYWPAFLLAADMKLPYHVIAHGHWLADGKKMSKSLGNVVAPHDLLEKYSVDAIRYFLLREGALDQDGNIHEDILKTRADAECANTLGNLASRALGKALLPKQQVPNIQTNMLSTQEQQLLETAYGLGASVFSAVESFNVLKASELVMDFVSSVNRYFANQEPWTLSPGKSNANPERLACILYTTIECLRVAGILFQPILPSTAKLLLDYLQVPDCNRTLQHVSAAYALQPTAQLGIEGMPKLILFEKKGRK